MEATSKEEIKVAIFDVEKLRENLELIKENCIEKTLIKYV